MKRRKLRENLMQWIYESSIKDELDKILDNYDFDKIYGEGDKEYINKVLSYLQDEMSNIDALIENASESWTIKRMNKVDLAIIRLCISENKCGLPVEISINESLELAKRFSTDKSASFVNGILGKILNE